MAQGPSMASPQRIERSMVGELQERIAEMLMCEPESLPPREAPLTAIEGWDSLRHVALILGLERELDQKLTATQIQAIVTLGDVADVLRRKFNG